MKKLPLLLFAGLLACASVSCGGDNEVKAPTEQSDSPADSPDRSKELSGAEAKMKARRAKGDTLAMPYAELIKYLPATIDGYKRDEPTGATVNMAGASYSNAEAKYTNDKGETIQVTLIDYNAAYNLYSSVTAMWAMGISVDTPEKKASGVKFEGDIGGWEEYGKKDRNAVLSLGIGYRFWLQINAENQDNTDKIKTIAKSMDLSKLAAL